MKRILIFAYGLFCYGVFLLVFLFLMGFLSNLLASWSIDRNATTSPAVALLINSVLIALFGLPHSVMARQRFKAWWTRFVPAAAERSTYVLVSALMLALLMWQWQPMTASVWTVENPPLRMLIWALYWLGHGVVLLASFLINHFELFGLQQSYIQYRQREVSASTFRTPLLYRVVRHPLQLGLFIAFWATPEMTAGRLLFALGMTGYMLIGLYFEERDLTAHFGEAYRQYQQTTPKLLPSFVALGQKLSLTTKNSL